MESDLKYRSDVRGLVNLGNTCFFNSTLQCLASLHTLRRHFCGSAAETAETAAAPSEGPITTRMRRFMRQMVSHDHSVYSPDELLSAVVKAAPRFKGNRQQDAQELLRYLLDAMQEEEKKIRKAVEQLAESTTESKDDVDKVEDLSAAVADVKLDDSENGVSADASSDDDDASSVLSETSERAPDDVVSRMFGGALLSCFVCKACNAASCVTEPYLDVSLPIPGSTTVKYKVYGAPKKRANNVVYADHRDTSRKKRGKKGRKEAPPPPPAKKSAEKATSIAETPATRAACPEIPSGWLSTASKVDLGRWIQLHGRPVMLSKLKITKTTKPVLFKSLDRSTVVKFIEIMQTERQSILAKEKEAQKELQQQSIAATVASEKANTAPPVEPASVTAAHIPSTPVQPASDATATKQLSEKDTQENAMPTASEAEVSAPAAVVEAQPEAKQDAPEACDKTEGTHVTTSSSPTQPDGTTQPLGSPGGEASAVSVAAGDADGATAVSVDASDAASSKLSEHAEPTEVTLAPSEKNDVENQLPLGAALKAGGSVLGHLLPPQRDVAGEGTDAYSLQNCLAAFTKTEELSESSGNGYACNTCRFSEKNLAAHAAAGEDAEDAPFVFTDASSRMVFLNDRMPEVLTIHLKRFATTHFHTLEKISKYVAFPEVLDITPFCTSGAKVAYRLCGVVVHSGGIGGGHYVAYVRYGKPVSFVQDGQHWKPDCGNLWAHVSDSHASTATLQQVMAAEAYLLFYERIWLDGESPASCC